MKTEKGEIKVGGKPRRKLPEALPEHWTILRQHNAADALTWVDYAYRKGGWVMLGTAVWQNWLGRWQKTGAGARIRVQDLHRLAKLPTSKVGEPAARLLRNSTGAVDGG